MKQYKKYCEFNAAMMYYNIIINNGNENIGAEGQSISVQESTKTAQNHDVAREINHQNPLMPEQVNKNFIDNFVSATLDLMRMGFAIQLKSGNDVLMRIVPDIKIVGGNINLERAQQLIPGTTELTKENAKALINAAGGVTATIRVEVMPKYNSMLIETKPAVDFQLENIIVRDKILRKDSSTDTIDTSTGTVDTSTNTIDPSVGGNDGMD